MNANSPDRLEHLICRVLDDEATSAERRQLWAWLRRDPGARALFEEYSAIDREVRVALRSTLGRPLYRPHRLAPWMRHARELALAAAACVALVVWLSVPQPAPTARPTPPTPVAVASTTGGSWFQPAPVTADVLESDALIAGERADASRREWIVVPGEKQDEFLVVEVRQSVVATLVGRSDF